MEKRREAKSIAIGVYAKRGQRPAALARGTARAQRDDGESVRNRLAESGRGQRSQKTI